MSGVLSGLVLYLETAFIGFLVFPLAFRFFPKLATRGFALVRPLGLLGWGYTFWLLTYLGILQNDIGGEITALIILGGVSFLIAGKAGIIKAWEWIKANRRTVLAIEGVALAFFAFWIWIRGMNPEIAYTEKPMELAFINAILRSDGFPPYDPWLSGYAISYYYFGYILLAMLIRVSGVISSVGFNLASALWFSMIAAATYGILLDLVTAWQGRVRPESETASTAKKPGLPLFSSLLGPLFVLIASTWEGFLEILHSAGVFWKLDSSGQLVSKFWTWLSINDLTSAPSQPFTWFPTRNTGWLWWRGSRVLQDMNMLGDHVEVIDEFPFFTFLLSDMHPHLLALPFVLLAIAFCLNLFQSSGGLFVARTRVLQKMRTPEFWMGGVLFGSLAFLNTWDFPIYVGLFCLVVLYFDIRNHGFTKKALINFFLNGILLGLLGGLLYLPFYIGFGSQAGGLLPSMEFMTRGIHFWILFGVLLVPILAWLIFVIGKGQQKGALLRGMKIALISFVGLFLLMLGFGLLVFSFQSLGPSFSASLNPVISGIGGKLSLAGDALAGVHGNFSAGEVLRETFLRRLQSPGAWLTLLGMFAVTIGVLTGKGAARQVASEEDQSLGQGENPRVEHFVLILVLLGIGLTTIPEFFYLRDQFGWRMNTIFKFYFQTWNLWGLAAGFATIVLFSSLRRSKAVLFQVSWILSLLLGLAYPVLMLWNKTNGFSMNAWTLDGNAYLGEYYTDDYAAIQWLEQQPLGVVAEAVGGSYTDYARISTRTGFPTVLGWPGHESQWRGGGTEMGSRFGDIQRLYESEDWIEVEAIIRRYNIRYIYVGSLELTTYPVQTGKFDSHLEIVYQNQGAIVYEVPVSIRTENP